MNSVLYMSEVEKFLINILSSAGVSVTLAAAVVWLSRTWISERLKASIQHEYDQKLAAYNAELKSRGETQIEMLKTSVSREAERLRFATSSFGEGQRASIEKKLDGVDTLWKGVLSVRANIPPVMRFIDVFTEDEYRKAGNDPTFKKLAGELSVEKISEMFLDSRGAIERVRPYVGEYLWALFRTYQILITRVVLLLHLGRDDAQKLTWHQDGEIRNLLQSSLSQEELRKFDEAKVGKINWLQRKFEHKILAAMEYVISGKKFSEEALKQAEVMEAQVAVATKEYKII